MSPFVPRATESPHATESVLLRDVVTDEGYKTQVVKRAFNRLEPEGVSEQLYLDDLGLSLSVGS